MKKKSKIVCIKDYEFEGKSYKKGDISEKVFGRPIMQPEYWSKLSDLAEKTNGQLKLKNVEI